MTWQALVFMVLVWAFIIVMTCYCFYKLLTSDREWE